MFCSKCGKEVQEGTAFCSSCGQPLQTANDNLKSRVQPQTLYVNQAISGSILGTPEEIHKKTLTGIFYLICTVVGLFFWLYILLNKLEPLSRFVDPSISNRTASVLEYIYEDYGAIIWCMALLYMYVPITQGISFWKACKKRVFSLLKKSVVTKSVIESVFWIAVPIFVNIVFSQRFDSYDTFVSFSFWLIVIVIIAFKIMYAALFCKAAKCEEVNMENERQNDKNSDVHWVCAECHAVNSIKDTVCQECGKRKEETSESQGWMCEDCQTINSKTAPFCKNCGKYR